MAKPSVTGIRRLIDATGYSMAGLRAAWQHEASIRQEVVFIVILTPLAFFVGQSAVEMALLIGSLLLILIIELINAAIETTIDRISDQQHVLSARAKDIGSAAVLMALINATVIWALILFY